MAMKQFDHRIKEEKFKPVLDLTYLLPIRPGTIDWWSQNGVHPEPRA